MAVDIRLSAVLLLVSVSSGVYTQERPSCSYMTQIPRPEAPIFPPEDWSDATWAQRPLIPAEQRDDVCMDEWTSNTQIIYMEESIEGEVTIARLNYDGSAIPAIGNFFGAGTFANLMPIIRRVDDEWHLNIRQRQDYEAGHRSYMFNINVAGESVTPVVSIVIVNIDDNPPILHLFDPCAVDELGDVGLIDCVYSVSDADGQISTQFMTFQVNSERRDDEIFEMEGENIPGDWFNMYMNVKLLEPLNFENSSLHVFTVTAFDTANNQTATMMVQVQNVDSRPPRWVNIFAVQQFDEKTIRNFTLRAIDGDTGINRPINYTLIRDEEDTFFSLENIEGGRDGAILHVDKIDRDTLMREVFQLTIVAYKETDRSFYDEANIVIIVNDVNDQKPVPLNDTYYISIYEETPMSLSFSEPFGFHDRDLGENAQYTVHLEDEYPPGAASAFQIHPNVGYQEQTFIMSTFNHSMLDYEVPEFQEIVIRVVATDRNNTEFVGVAMVHINLINWNDELPIFEQDNYTAQFKETVGAGFPVATVRAYDRDIDDQVVHTLMGNADQYLYINETSGEIFVSVDEAFDYHRQSILFVQVRADDTLGNTVRNTATTQLQIQLEDINNTPPTLRLPRVSPSVEENVPKGFEIPGMLNAIDPDTTAELYYEIDWDESWATKAGVDTPEIEYRGCVEIRTEYPTVGNTMVAEGYLVVQEIRDNITIDFEMFEVLHLTVRVIDRNTVHNEPFDEATYTIRIIDMNDNRPIFGEEQVAQSLRVREGSASSVIIGSMIATDIDGPLYNQVRYTLEPRDGTPEGLVKIDFESSQMTVDADGAIDADIPPRYHLYYSVIASDECYFENRTRCPPDLTFWETKLDIAIEIIDTNDQEPFPKTDEFSQRVYIWENATHGEEVQRVISSDLDRDVPFHTTRYQINYNIVPRLQAFFAVDDETGMVYVHFTTPEVLDRDGEEPTHTIRVIISDNINRDGDGWQNTVETQLEVILIDVNDNAPVLESGLQWSLSENTEEGLTLNPQITATDRDDPTTENARVGFSILNMTAINREDLELEDMKLEDLFTITDLGNNNAELTTNFPLRGFWGTYGIAIEAFDHGNPQLDSYLIYELVVRPYNFHNPVFEFPRTGSTIRLHREWATGGALWTPDGNPLARIHATDEDGLHAGSVQFHIQGNEEAAQYFRVDNDGDNYGTLMLQTAWDTEQRIREFRITIRATDGGTEPGPFWTDSVVTVIFVPTQGDPTFSTPAETVGFTEGEEGLSQSAQLASAQDEKNYQCEHDVCYNIYYRILEGNDGGYFTLDPTTNELRLARQLDRSAAASHTIMVAASNAPDATHVPLQASILAVTINVREANPRPIFERILYTAGISMTNSIGRVLLTVRATHTEDDTITYHIDQDSMQLDSNLEPVRTTAFQLHQTTGVLTLTFQPTPNMYGMFDFEVIATDSAEETDTTQIKVYLISSQNRVFFIFLNTVEEIDPLRTFIEDVFSEEFRMHCNIDEVLPATNDQGVALDDRTEVRAHFIRNNVPVPASEIEQMRSDMSLLNRIQLGLDRNSLVLDDVMTDGSGAGAVDATQTTIYVLAALSALLAVLCLVLLLTFFFRTRALNRRLKALSMTKYGSEDSGLNRAGFAPGTNKHAAEGANPIWNEAIKAPDFDAISDTSGDSDLIGIEDLPQFRDDYFPPGDNNSVDDIFNPRGNVSSHNNNFGFNSSPFSPAFNDKNFRR